MSDLQSLAADVLAMFEQQKEYFQTRNPEQLNRCKGIEARLRKRCKEIVEAKKVKPNLFSDHHNNPF